MAESFDFAVLKGKRVLVTGHTGFKGTWLCKALLMHGADVTGYSLDPPTDPSLFELSGIESEIRSVKGDIRDREKLGRVFSEAKPEIVLHLAAQPIVLESYRDPVYTYETNVMGTVNVLECTRQCGTVRSFLNVTTDKVYRNKEWHWGYRENEELFGYDPYSNSKSCSELVTETYKNCYLSGSGTAVSTARAGNVIGGGDFAADRIIPDCIRAASGNGTIIVRNPASVRPFQHVIEPIFAYMAIAAAQLTDASYADCYNIGPDEADCITAGMLTDIFIEAWGDGVKRLDKKVDAPKEASFLRLDNSKAKSRLGIAPVWDIKKAVEKTVELSKQIILGDGSTSYLMEKQINEYMRDKNEFRRT